MSQEREFLLKFSEDLKFLLRKKFSEDLKFLLRKKIQRGSEISPEKKNSARI